MWERPCVTCVGLVLLRWSCSPVSVLCGVTWHLLCRFTKYTVVSIALGSSSTMGMMAVGPGLPRALFSQGRQYRSTEVGSQDCSSCASGPGVRAMEAAQTLAQPSPCMHTHTKSTTANARPVPAAGTLVFHLGCPAAAEFTKLSVEV